MEATVEKKPTACMAMISNWLLFLVRLSSAHLMFVCLSRSLTIHSLFWTQFSGSGWCSYACDGESDSPFVWDEPCFSCLAPCSMVPRALWRYGPFEVPKVNPEHKAFRPVIIWLLFTRGHKTNERVISAGSEKTSVVAARESHRKQALFE